MTEPRDSHDRYTETTAADRELEVRPEVITDLDVTADDADAIVGGCEGRYTCVCSQNTATK